MSHLVISKKNEVYLQIEADPHIYYELRDAFQELRFEIKNGNTASFQLPNDENIIAYFKLRRSI